MVFGDGVVVPATADAASWIDGACRGAWGTVGALVPNDYEMVARVAAPDAEIDGWWDAYGSLYSLIAVVGARHTSAAGSAWFAVWEGYGWETSTSLCATDARLSWFGRRKMKAAQALLRREDRRRQVAVRAGLASVPRFALPHRGYYLVGGAVSDVDELREPGAPDRWQRPDLLWPDDRAWFVASDVDFWSIYVGGSAAFIEDISTNAPTRTDSVSFDHELVPED